MTEAPEKRDWQRMGARVHQLIQLHPLVQPILDRHRFISIHFHTKAIWAQAGYHPTETARGLYEARIEAESWWEPQLDTTEDWARRLTVRLAKGLRAQWDQRPGDHVVSRGGAP